jgi:hypothetical protein
LFRYFFEKDLNNVKHAVIQDKIEYPVALDSHFVTWQNFNNQKANEAYDYVLNKRQQNYNDNNDNNDELILKPHWHPYENGHA